MWRKKGYLADITVTLQLCDRRTRSDRSIARRSDRSIAFLGIADDDAPGGDKRRREAPKLIPPKRVIIVRSPSPPGMMLTHLRDSIFITIWWYIYPPRSLNCSIWVENLRAKRAVLKKYRTARETFFCQKTRNGVFAFHTIEHRAILRS